MKQLFPFSINDPLPTIKNVTETTKYGYIDNGKDVLDLSLGSCGSFPLGFTRTDITDYVYDGLKRQPFCPGDFATTNSSVNKLSEKLYDLSCGFYSMYSSSGSDSIEGAIKLVHMYHLGKKHKNKIIGFKKSYHGSTYMSTSVGGNTYMLQTFGRHHECIDIDYNDIEEYLDDSTKAVVIETASWGNNLQSLPEGYFTKLRQLCDKHDALLVIDDIAFCGGKAGHVFGFDSIQAKPDIFTLGKGISGGYFQLAITMCNQKVADIVKPQFLLHGFTYSFPMPGILSTLKYLEILETENILSKYDTIVNMGASVANQLLSKNLIKDYRQFGACLSLTPTKVIKDTHERDRIFYENGLHLGVWNGESDRILIMTTILPDSDYFDSLEHKLTLALN